MAENILDLSTTLYADVKPWNNTMSAMPSVADSAFQTIKDSAKAYLGASGLVGTFVKSTRAANEFGQQMADLAAITDLNMQKIQKSILQLPNYFGGLGKVSSSLYEIVSSGFRGLGEEELIEFQKAISVSSKVIRADIYATGDAMTTLANAYKLDMEQINQLQDWFYLTVREGKAHGDELARTLGLVINNAAEAGIKLDELGGAISILSRTQSTSQAMIGLNQMINGLIGPTLQAQAAAKKWGVELGAAALESKGFSAMLAEIHERVGGNVEALKAMFGNIRAARAVLSLTGKQFGDFISVLGEYDKGYGTGMEAFLKQIDTAQNQFERLGIQAEKTLVTIGQDVEPVSKMLAGLGEAALAGFADSTPLARYTTYVLAITESFKMMRNAIDSVTRSITGLTAAQQVNQGLGSAPAMRNVGYAMRSDISRPERLRNAIVPAMNERNAGGYGSVWNTKLELVKTREEIAGEAKRNISNWYKQVTTKGKTSYMNPVTGRFAGYDRALAHETSRLTGNYKLGNETFKKVRMAWREQFLRAKKGERLDMYGASSSERFNRRFGYNPSSSASILRHEVGSILPKSERLALLGKTTASLASGVKKFTSEAIDIIGRTAMWVGGTWAALDIGWNIGKSIGEKFKFEDTAFVKSLQTTTIGGWLAGLGGLITGTGGGFGAGTLLDADTVSKEISEYNRQILQNTIRKMLDSTTVLGDGERLTFYKEAALISTEQEAVRLQQALNAAIQRRTEELNKLTEDTRQEKLQQEAVEKAQKALEEALNQRAQAGTLITPEMTKALSKREFATESAAETWARRNIPKAESQAGAAAAQSTMEAAGFVFDRAKFDEALGWLYTPGQRQDWMYKEMGKQLYARQFAGGQNVPPEILKEIFKTGNAADVLKQLGAIAGGAVTGKVAGLDITPTQAKYMEKTIRARTGIGGDASAEQRALAQGNVAVKVADLATAEMRRDFTKYNRDLQALGTGPEGSRERLTRTLATAEGAIEDDAGGYTNAAIALAEADVASLKRIIAGYTTASETLMAKADERKAALRKEQGLSGKDLADAEKAIDAELNAELNLTADTVDEKTSKLVATQQRLSQLQDRKAKAELKAATEKVMADTKNFYERLGVSYPEFAPESLLRTAKDRISSTITSLKRQNMTGTGDKVKNDIILKELESKLKEVDQQLSVYDDAIAKRFQSISEVIRDQVPGGRGRITNNAMYQALLLAARSNINMGWGKDATQSSLTTEYGGSATVPNMRKAQEAQNKLAVVMDAYILQQRLKDAAISDNVEIIANTVQQRVPLFLR